MAAVESDFGAFVKKFLTHPTSTASSEHLPLKGLPFAVKDIYDIEGYVTGFGNPDWARTHSPAVSTAPSVSLLLNAGATCVGKTVMDEMAYCLYGENKHFGTPVNPCAPDRIPGGSSSGSAVAVAAKLADFSLGLVEELMEKLLMAVDILQAGTDTGASVRVPAAFCGIYGFRPSHAVVPISGVIPMAQSFDTVGWFARDPVILNKVGQVLLQSTNVQPVQPSFLIIPDDCFKLLNIPYERVTEVLIKSFKKVFGGLVVRHTNLGDYVMDKVPSLKHFVVEGNDQMEYNIPSLMALSSALRYLQRLEFRNNHEEWINSVKPDLGPGISERIQEALKTTNENIEICNEAKEEFCTALTALLEESGILVLPTFPGPPFKLQTDTLTLEHYHAKAFSLLSVAGFSGFCQVSIPLGMYDNLPVAVSLLAKHGADGFLLNLVEALDGPLKEQVEIAQDMGY